MAYADLDIIDRLFHIIESRRGDDPETSYTASLYASGRRRIAQKVGEEATETVIAAIARSSEEVAEESADLLFHLLVLWSDVGITPQDVREVLANRQGRSGHDEKRSRKKSDDSDRYKDRNEGHSREGTVRRRRRRIE